MHKSSVGFISGAFAALLLGGCSSDGLLSGITTQSINATPTTVAAAPKVDPACLGLSQRINALRSDGLTERLEKAATGKSASVTVKRTSLAQAAELDRANSEFQARCAAPGLRPPVQASLAPAAAPLPVQNTSQVVSAAPTSAPPVIVQQPPR